MGRGKKRTNRRGDQSEVIHSYGRAQALSDGVISEREVTSAPDFVPLFDAGRVAVTPAAAKALAELGLEADELINRHITGDWGDIHPEDRAMGLNEQALKSGARILSVYRLRDDLAVWMITDAVTDACPDCHDFYGGTPNPDCPFCHGTTWGEEERRLTSTVLLPSEY